LSLLASIFTTPFLISIFTDWGDFHGGVGLILISGLYIIYPFVLSLAAYLNLIKGFQKNNYLSFFSFTFLPLFFPINLLYEFKIGLDLKSIFETIIPALPYIICMIISSVLFRKFCAKLAE